MKVLVTGAEGFIGSHLTELLVEKGFEVKGIISKMIGDGLKNQNIKTT